MPIKPILRAAGLLLLGLVLTFSRWPNANALQVFIPLTFGIAAGLALGRARLRSSP